MKSALILCLILCLGFVLWKRRRRVHIALQVVSVLYVIMMIVRLAQSPDDIERLSDVAAITGGFALVWLVLWLVTRFVAERRARSGRGQDRAVPGEESSTSRAIADK